MSDMKPIAASLAEIKTAFPKAKADFVLSCLEKQLPMASVMTEALGAMEEELTGLRAKLAEYEQKMAMETEKPAEAMEEEVPVEAMEEEEMKAKAKAKAKSGVKPIAKGQSVSKPTARAQWHTEINARIAAGKPRADAIMEVDRHIPGLREAMLTEVNA